MSAEKMGARNYLSFLKDAQKKWSLFKKNELSGVLSTFNKIILV